MVDDVESQAAVQLDLDLEADHVAVVGALGRDGDDAQRIREALPVLLVVGDLKLQLRPRLNSLPHLVDGDLVGALDRIGRVPLLAVGDLEEATVTADDFAHGVAGHVAERVGGVDDGTVGLLEIAHDEGDGAVDGAELDDRVRAGHDLELVTRS